MIDGPSPDPMSTPGARLLEIARRGTRAVWVRVERVRGSAPREAGASMIVGLDGEPEGTIGGGHLEFEAIAQARRMLAADARVATRGVVLGAALGQCCGGAVELSLRAVDARERDWLGRLAALERDGGIAWLDTARDPGPGAAHTRFVDHAPDDVHGDAHATRVVSRLGVAPWHV